MHSDFITSLLHEEEYSSEFNIACKSVDEVGASLNKKEKDPNSKEEMTADQNKRNRDSKIDDDVDLSEDNNFRKLQEFENKIAEIDNQLELEKYNRAKEKSDKAFAALDMVKQSTTVTLEELWNAISKSGDEIRVRRDGIVRMDKEVTEKKYVIAESVIKQIE
jgi:hypothetical protein